MFENLKVVELASVLAGPLVGTFFAELGARVLKIEHPIYGDVTNTWRLTNEQDTKIQSAYYSSVNYQKEKLKLKDELTTLYRRRHELMQEHHYE